MLTVFLCLDIQYKLMHLDHEGVSGMIYGDIDVMRTQSEKYCVQLSWRKVKDEHPED